MIDAFSDLVRVETVVWNRVDARLRAELDLTLARYEHMRLLSGGPRRVLDLARVLAITGGGSSKVIDRVEAAGHCRRRDNPADRRSSLVELTPAGERVLAEADRVVAAELDRCLAALPPARRTSFSRDLRALRVHLVG